MKSYSRPGSGRADRVINGEQTEAGRGQTSATRCSLGGAMDRVPAPARSQPSFAGSTESTGSMYWSADSAKRGLAQEQKTQNLPSKAASGVKAALKHALGHCACSHSMLRALVQRPNYPNVAFSSHLAEAMPEVSRISGHGPTRPSHRPNTGQMQQRLLPGASPACPRTSEPR